MELHKRYEYTTRPGQITTTGISAIQRYVASQRPMEGDWKALNPKQSSPYLPMLPEQFDWVWLVERGELSGTFPKRVAKHYRRAYNIKCPDSFIAEIGNLSKRHSEEGETFRFDFTSRIDWQEGEFGDDGSCFWDDRAGAKAMLQDNHGLAIRFYDQYGGPLGRALFFRMHFRRHVVWNGYGFPGDATLTITRVMSGFLGLPYGQIELRNCGTASGVMWINGGRAFMVAPDDYLAITRGIDLCWEEQHKSCCHHCGILLPLYEIRYGPDNKAFCDDCFGDHCAYCDFCDGTYWSDEVRYTDHGDVCDWCFQREFTSCEVCDDDIHRDNADTFRNMTVCISCRERKLEAKSAGKK